MTLPKNLHKDAIKCFKLVQKVMTDASKGPPFYGSLKEFQSLLEKGIFQGGLRDEIYVQICKVCILNMLHWFIGLDANITTRTEFLIANHPKP
jgi:hypothetical protein